MIDWPRPLALPRVTLPGPIELRKAAKQASRTGRGAVSPRFIEEARQILARARRGEVVNPTRAQCRGLLHLREQRRELDRADRLLAARLVVEAHQADGWLVRAVWEDVTELREDAAKRLSNLATIDRLKGRGVDFLPTWLRNVPSAALTVDLQTPGPRFARWVHGAPVTIEQLNGKLAVSPSSQMANELTLAALQSAPDVWWRGLGAPSQLRSWASEAGLRATAIVADKQLLVVGGNAAAPVDIPKSAEADDLLAWTRRVLIDPDAHPARWEGVSTRARIIFEWLFIANEIHKILEIFRRDAMDKGRGTFWQRHARYLLDARYVKASDGTAVCIMRVGGHVFIEFGSVGNAAYIYELLDGPVFRKLKLQREPVTHFKSWDTLRLGRLHLSFRDRIIHREGWEYGASRLVEQASHAVKR